MTAKQFWWGLVVVIALIIIFGHGNGRMSNRNFDYCDAIYTAGTSDFDHCMDTGHS